MYEKNMKVLMERIMTGKYAQRSAGRENGPSPYCPANTYLVQNMIEAEIGMGDGTKADWGEDHDRIRMWHYDEFDRVNQEHMGCGDLGIGQWARESPSEKVIAYLQAIIDIFQAENPVGERKTVIGGRVIRRSDMNTGYPVFHLDMVFKKREPSENPETSQNE